MDPVSMSPQSHASQIISNAVQKQGNVLLQLFEVVRQAEIAQGKPLANLANKPENLVDVYA